MVRKRIMLLVLCLTTAGITHGQDAAEAPGQYYALLFAGDVYEHWNDLQNPINDARTLGNELRDTYGFEVDLVENPTQEVVLSKVRDYATRSYNKNDHVLIFFAGHGKFDEIDGEGYLVTTDSRADDETNMSYLPYSQLRTRVNNIPSHHVLLVLDACFGGTFDPGVRGDDPAGNLAREEYIARKLRFQTRRYITSGGKEYVPDGRPGHHSPFMRQWLEALRTYGGRDGILTLGEIYQRLEYVDPLPLSGQFGDNEPGSDFLFIARSEETTPQAASDVEPQETAPDAETGQPAEEAVSENRAEKTPDETPPAEAVPEAIQQPTEPETQTAAALTNGPVEETKPIETPEAATETPPAEETLEKAAPPETSTETPEPTTETLEAATETPPAEETLAKTAPPETSTETPEAATETPPAEETLAKTAPPETSTKTAEPTTETPEAATETPPAEETLAKAAPPETSTETAEPNTETPEPNTETAKVDSIHVATTNLLVDHVRASMDLVKSTIPPALQQTPLYQEAISLEDRGQQLYKAGGYTQAAVRFEEARAKYEQAARAGAAEEEVTPALQTAIDDYVLTLKTSVEAEERGGMGAMAYRDRDWGAFFETAHEITAEVHPGPVQVMNDGATVMVELALTYKDAQEQPVQETLTHLWVLQDMGGGWLLTKATPQPQ